MSDWLKIILLGIVEGTTEFLPISSTGHLIVTQALLNFDAGMNGTFEIFIQFGAVVAVLAYYRHDLLRQARALPVRRETQRFWAGIVIAVLPAGLLGILLLGWIKEVLFSPVVVAAALIVGGLIFLLVERHSPEEAHATDDIMCMTLRQAFLVGVVQIAALIPGMSRSGASIIGGMQAGLSRRAATQFSFYLAIPTLGGATLVELVSVLAQVSSTHLVMLLLGALVSGVVAWVSIGWLLRYVSTNTFVSFGYYRIIAGVLILLAALAGIVQ